MEQTVETVSWGLFWRFIKIMHKRAHFYANNIKAQQKVVIFTTSLSPDPANWTNYCCKHYCEYPIICIFFETSSASCFCSLLPLFPEFKCNSFSGILSQCCFLDRQHCFHKSNSSCPAPHISKWPLFSLYPLHFFSLSWEWQPLESRMLSRTPTGWHLKHVFSFTRILMSFLPIMPLSLNS